MTLGISRDDAGAFIPIYLDKGIFPVDRFKTIDEDMELAGW
jgi:pyruvate,orthophosphate dikinase